MIEPHLVALASPVVAAVVVAVGRRRGVPWPGVAAHLAVTGALILVAAFTLFPFPVRADLWRYDRVEGFATLVPFRTIRAALAYGLVDVEIRHLVGNVVLFVPLGFALPLAVPRLRRALPGIAAGAAVSVAVEVLQMVLPLHGADLDDVILNTLGAAAGHVGYRFAAAGLRAATGRARRSGGPCSRT